MKTTVRRKPRRTKQPVWVAIETAPRIVCNRCGSWTALNDAGRVAAVVERFSRDHKGC